MADSVIGSPFTPNLITGETTKALVEGRFNTTLEQALYFSDLARTALQDLLTEEVLVNVVDRVAEIIQNMDTLIGFDWIANPLLGVAIPATIERPVLDDITVETREEPFYTPTSGEYSSDLVTTVKTTLTPFISGRDTGIDADTEQAEYDLLTRRQAAENQRRYAQAEATAEAMGWCVPQASYMALMGEVANQINDKNTEINLGVYVEHEKMIQQNRQFAITAGIDLEKALMAFMEEMTKIGIQLYIADVQKFDAVIDAQVKYADIRSKRNENVVKLYEADIKDRETVFRAITSAFAEEVKEAIARSELYLKREVAKLEAWVSLYRTKDEIIRAWAAILAQIASAIWGSVNASAALHFNEGRSDSTSQSRSYGESRSESVSVNYNVNQ